MFQPHDPPMEPVDDHRLTEAIAHALWKNHQMRPRRKSLDEARFYAGFVVDHLRRCGMMVIRHSTPNLHSTPEPHGSDTKDKA